MKYIYLFIFSVLSIINTSNAQCWESLSAGQLHTVGIRNDGTLWAWGYNNFWQLGLGNNTSVNTPTQIGTDTTWHIVSSGRDYTMALKDDGTLWAWGANTSGKLGVGGTSVRTTPTQVGTANNWEKVVASEGEFTVAIKTDGTLWTWGANNFGQLGNGSTTNTSVLIPTQIGTDTNWKEIAAGLSHVAAIKDNGALWTWGVGGVLGDTTTANRYAPMQASGSLIWSKITAGKRHTLAIATNGTLWTWGDNQFGQLGDGTTINKMIPTQIGTANNWGSFSAWENSTVAIRTDGTLWTWGSNTFGQLGDGTTIGKTTPFQIGTANDWTELSIGQSNTSAIKLSSFRWAWGNNSVGQLGDATNVDKLSPIVIVCLSALPINLISFIGEKVQGTNQLKWIVNNSADLSSFELERSEDGFMFVSQGSVPRIGSNNEVVTYQFTDVNPLAKINYYRLKQVNINNTAEYSHVININNTTTETVFIFPNPVTNSLQILGLNDPINATPYIITDVTGKQLLKGNVMPGEKIDITKLSAGIYYVVLTDNILRFNKQ